MVSSSLLDFSLSVSKKLSSCEDIAIQSGVCKTRTGYLRMAGADGKMRIEICGWKKKCG